MLTIRRWLAPLVDQLIALRYQAEFKLRGDDYRLPMRRAARICARLCERELRLHGVWFTRNADNWTYRVDRGDGFDVRLNLFNVTRQFASDGEIYRIIQLVASILDDIPYPDDWSKIQHQIFWTIQSNSLVEQSDLAVHLSDQTHLAPVHYDPTSGDIVWLASHMLIGMSVSEETMVEAVHANLAAELSMSELIVQEFESVRFAVVATRLPFKTALILAPNLRDVLEPILGWPLLAVIPRREFMYLYDARCFKNGVLGLFEKFPGLGEVVLEEHEFGAYPLSTEIFEITDDGVRAIAEYRRRPEGQSEPTNKLAEVRVD